MSTSAPRYPLIAFFLIAYALSWTVWGTALAHERGILTWHLPGSFAFLAVSVAAVGVTAWATGRTGLRELGTRLIRWRVGARWYVAALLLPAAPAAAAVALYLLAGGTHDVGALVPLAAALPLLLTQLLTHLLTEELGWRGFALPRLRQRYGALTASVILGLVWAVWHTPLFLLADTRQSYPYLGFVVMAVSISIMMTWIFDRTGGSILIAALFHAAMNTAWAVLNVLWGSTALFWLCVGLIAVTASIVIAVQERWRVGSGPEAPSSSSELGTVAAHRNRVTSSEFRSESR